MALDQGEASHRVCIGSVVTIRGQLTTRTPLGRALLGRRSGEEVSIHTEAGTAKFTIVGIKG